MAASMKMKCYIISPLGDDEETYNLKMVNCFNAEIIRSHLSSVSETIDNVISDLKQNGLSPYFIMGGGHGNLGTQAYVDCYNEIADYETNNNIKFDYIFHASGTGTTQAGLICGKILHKAACKIVGISIAREKTRGSKVILDSVTDYMTQLGANDDYTGHINFIDDYTLNGYGKYNDEIDNVIGRVLTDYGIPLNRTYTGKAFWGMEKYMKSMKITGKNILFIHTGGTPLFFDYLEGLQK